MKRFPVLILLAALFSNSSFAIVAKEDCSDVDFENELGAPRVQGALGWCYGYAAADLLSFQLKEKISATPIVFSQPWLHFGKKDIKQTDSGYISKSLRRSLSDGLCLEEDYESYGPNVQSAYQMSPHSFHDDLNVKCSKRIEDPGFEVKTEKLKNQLTAMNQVLNSNNITEVSIDSDIYKKTEKDVWKTDHSVLVTGRRWNTAKTRCEYHLRNAWGNGCGAYRKELNCVGGRIWMPDTDLEKSTKSITYLIPPKRSYDMLVGMTITHDGLVTKAGVTQKTQVVQTITHRDAEKIGRHMKLSNIADDGTATITQEYDDAYSPDNFWTKDRIDPYLQKCRDESRMGWITVNGKNYRGCPHTENYDDGSSLIEWVGKVPFGNLHSEFKAKSGSTQVYNYAGTIYPEDDK